MSLDDWYDKTFLNYFVTKNETVAIIADPTFRPRAWVPKWNLAEFNRAQMEMTAASSLNIVDPRLDVHWQDENWDDVLLDQWWQYVVMEYRKTRLEELSDV